MRLSTKGEYGLLALLDLALQNGAEPIHVKHIAERQGIPKQYLDQLLVTLKRAGLVASSRGRQGGYRLARAADKITLLDAVCCLEGPVVNDNFQSRSAHPKRACHGALKGVWADLTEHAADLLRSRTLQDLVTDCRKSEESTMYHI